MRELFNRIFRNPRSSFVAVLVIGASIMVYQGKMTVADWALAVGSLGGLYGLLKKDNDI